MSVSASASALTWATSADKRIDTATDPGQLSSLGAQADRYAGGPGLSLDARAELRLTATAAYGRLAELHIGTKDNGIQSFHELQAAVRLAPNDPYVASSYGRALLIISNLNWFIRLFAAPTLGINLNTEMQRDLGMLAANPQNPLCQLLRQDIAHYVGDKASQAAAKRQLTLLAATDPQGLAKARNDLASDTTQARSIKKN